MTVSSTESIIAFVANGTQTAFPCDFKVLEEAHVQVYVDSVLQTLSTDYTLSGVPGDSFTVNFVSAPADGAHISVARVLPLVQETDYLENDEFPAETHERALDLLTMMVQQVAQGAAGKAVRFPAGDSAALTGILPAAASRAQKLLGFASDGEVVAVVGADLGAFSPGDQHTWTAQQIMQVAAGTDGWTLQDLSGNTLAKFRATSGTARGSIIVTDGAANEGVIVAGSGSPEGVRGAQLGTIYIDAASSTIYRKEEGAGTSTGWKALGPTVPVRVALSGASVTVTSVPPRTRRITATLINLSTNGSNTVSIRLGTSGGLATSGYSGTRMEVQSGAASAGTDTDRLILLGTMDAATVAVLKIEMTWLGGNNHWSIEARGFDNAARDRFALGHLVLGSNPLDRFQILLGGSDVFDGGELAYMYE